MESNGEAAGLALHKAWVQARLEAERYEKQMDGMQDIHEMLIESALWDDRREWGRQVADRAARLQALQAHLAQQEPYVAPVDGTCAVEGCNMPGQYVNTGCTEGVLRCKQHWGVSCWGGWRGCGCCGQRPGRQKKHSSCSRKHKAPLETTRRRELLNRFNAGEVLWMRAALVEGDRRTVVAGQVVSVIQEPAVKNLKTPSHRTRWKSPSEAYIMVGDEEVSVMLDGLEWEILDEQDWEGIDLDTPECSDVEDEDPDEHEVDLGPLEQPGDGKFVVEQVLKLRHTRNGQEYYVHWEGYDSTHDNWEPEDHFKNEGTGRNGDATAFLEAELGVSDNNAPAGGERPRTRAQAARERVSVTFEEAERFLAGYTQGGEEIEALIGDPGPPIGPGDGSRFDEAEQFLEAYTQDGEEISAGPESNNVMGDASIEDQLDQAMSQWGDCEGDVVHALVDAGWWHEDDAAMWEEEGRRVLEQQDEGDEELPMWVFDDMG